MPQIRPNAPTNGHLEVCKSTYKLCKSPYQPRGAHFLAYLDVFGRVSGIFEHIFEHLRFVSLLTNFVSRLTNLEVPIFLAYFDVFERLWSIFEYIFEHL